MSDQTPTPTPSLSDEINIATRSLHTTLNRLITSRLPLALPPHTTDPTLYTTGLLHFSHIFLTFESLWTDLIASAPQSSASPQTSQSQSPLLSYLLVNPYDNPDLFTPASSPPPAALTAFLARLRPRGLPRSARVKRDLEFLTGLSSTDIDVLLASYPGDKVAAFCTHIRGVCGAKPHVLVAYAWCFYMAVFSGGRWIRAQLVEAGEEFWRPDGTEKTRDGKDEERAEKIVPLEERGLSFWNFPGKLDGEDIKAEFKARLAEVETLLNAEERRDVIAEAGEIFKLCASVVEELDEKFSTDIEGLDRLAQAGKKKGEKGEKGEKSGTTVTLKISRAPGVWLRRPEVTGAVVALGCLACVAFFKMESKVGW